MSKYLFKGTDINTIIQSGSTTVGGNSFIGFPTSDFTNFPILKPLPLGIILSNTDISNSCTVTTLQYNSPITINSSSFPLNANYISAICVGGGGGGGGGGGTTWMGSGSNAGGNGGNGGLGTYTAMGKFPITSNSNIIIDVGIGGLGGAGGAGAANGGSNSGSGGSGGSIGGSSSISIDNTTNGVLCFSPGGNGGGGGATGNMYSGGFSGSNGNTPTGNTTGFGDNALRTNTSSSNFPPQNGGNGGLGGNGGPGMQGGQGTINSNGNSGQNGVNGYVELIYLYE